MASRKRKYRDIRKERYKRCIWICEDSLLAQWGTRNGGLYLMTMFDRMFDRPTYYYLGDTDRDGKTIGPREIGELLMALKRITPDKSLDASRSAGFDDAAFAKDYPTLYEHLTATTWEDGTARIPSSIIMFAEEGMLKACLSERNDQMSLWASGNGLKGVLKALEGALNTPAPQWRKQKSQGGKKK